MSGISGHLDGSGSELTARDLIACVAREGEEVGPAGSHVEKRAAGAAAKQSRDALDRLPPDHSSIDERLAFA